MQALFNDYEYLPSSTPGKHWQVYVGTTKSRAGFVTGNASHGVYKDDDHGFSSFTTVLFQDAYLTAETTHKRATAKAKADALAAIKAKLKAEGRLADTEQAAPAFELAAA